MLSIYSPLSTPSQITLLIDGQALFPSLYPNSLRSLYLAYCETFNDTLMHPQSRPAWLPPLIAFELVFQVPFFFLAARAFMIKDEKIKPYATAYSAHAVTAIVPILHHFVLDDEVSQGELRVLLAFYGPYLILPGILLVCCLASPDSLFSKGDGAAGRVGIGGQHATVGKAKLY